MKKSIILFILLLPTILAASVGDGVSPDIITEDFPPEIWMCNSRTVLDDATQPGRISFDGEFLQERINNYAFEGEQISWKVLVMDKNGIEKISDVFVSLSSRTGDIGNIEANCAQSSGPSEIPDSCNARISEEELNTFDPSTQRYYDCTFTVESSASMYGEYFVNIGVSDLDGLESKVSEAEYWFFNPIVSLTIDGTLSFGNVRPGTQSYSSLLVGNDADPGSGVLLDMFITGTNFYDTSSSGAKCPISNVLPLSAFRYYVPNGAYSTSSDPRSDAEGYIPIGYGIGFNDPTPFYNSKEILQSGPKLGPYWLSNILSPGAKIPVTFRLSLPEPCNGDFDSGKIMFWGEAV
jgi:hypothetical protein